MIVALLLAVLVAAPAPSAGPTTPAEKRVLLRTSAGDLVVELLPTDAPKTVAYFEELVRERLYDGTQIFRIEPGFVLQSSLVEFRDNPLTPQQRSLVHRVPFEPSGLKHVRGSLSLAHPDGDLDGGTSSFSILLNDAPHLDGKYVIFGRVVEGFDVLDEIAAVPLNPRHQPLIEVAIQSAELVSAEDAHRWRVSRKALFSAAAAYEQNGMRRELVGLLSVILFGTIAMSLLGARLSRRIYNAARLIILLLGGLGLLLVLFPVALRTPAGGAGLFFGLIGLFKLLGRFETAKVASGSPAQRHEAGNPGDEAPLGDEQTDSAPAPGP